MPIIIMLIWSRFDYLPVIRQIVIELEFKIQAESKAGESVSKKTKKSYIS